MDLNIRSATSEDVLAIAELAVSVQQLHHDNVPSLFKRPDINASIRFFEEQVEDESAHVFIASKQNRVVGYLYAFIAVKEENDIVHQHRSISIEHLVVAEQLRGKGVGGVLLDVAERWATDIGIDRMTLSAWSFNESAIALYERKGFAEFKVNMEKLL